MPDEGEEARDSVEPSEESALSGVRRVVEDISVTPFFMRHSSHMPATIKLKADMMEGAGYLMLRAQVAGFSEEHVEVSATENSIHLRLHSGEKEKTSSGAEAFHEDDVALHSSYVTPVEIEPGGVEVSFDGDFIEVKAPKKK